MRTNCRKLTPFGRRLLVDRVLLEGWPAARAAEAAGVSRQTAYRWVKRWHTIAPPGLHSMGIPVVGYRAICSVGDLPATGIPIRYERDCPGELVHVDIKKLGRIPDGGGWRVLGREKAGPKQKVGYEYLHSMVDDHSRMAYSEVLDTDDGQTCARFMLRAAHWFASYGYRIDRVMTDNAWAYRRSQDFADALDQIKAAHKLIRPYRPQTNGKVERFHQTILRGWAYKRPYTTNQARRQALTRFLRTYNHHRPHSSLRGQPPITRLVTHLCGKDT